MITVSHTAKEVDTFLLSIHKLNMAITKHVIKVYRPFHGRMADLVS